MLGNAERVEEFVATVSRTVAAAGDDMEGGLRQLARVYLRLVMQPDVLRLRRLVMGEAGRFPDLARTYYERVPGRVINAKGAGRGENDRFCVMEAASTSTIPNWPRSISPG